jgi:hypothetical protein
MSLRATAEIFRTIKMRSIMDIRPTKYRNACPAAIVCIVAHYIRSEYFKSDKGTPSRSFRPVHGLGRPIGYCRDGSEPSLTRLLGALLHVSRAIDDLQVRDAPEGQQCRPRSLAIISPDLEQGNAVIDLGILDQPFAGCETAALLKNLQVPDMIARRNP